MNSVVTPAWTLRKVGTRLNNSLRFVGQISKSYNSEFKQGGTKVGATVNARLPQRYVVNTGAAFVPQPITDNVVPITITDQANVGLQFDTFTLTLQVEDYKSRYIDPAAEAMAAHVDYQGMARSYKGVYQTVGTPGVPPGSTGTLPQAASNVYMGASTKLSNIGVSGRRWGVISPDMHQYLVAAFQAVFHPAGDITKQYKTGQVAGEALGAQAWYMDQSTPTHTVGALGGTPLLNMTSVSEGATSLVTDGWTAAAANRLKEGDVIQVAGCYAVNPHTRQSTRQLQDFVVTADADSDGSGNLTVSVQPPLRSTGQWQTVSAMPANNAAITIFGHASSYASVQTAQGLLATEEAFAMVTADLEKPMGVWASERISNKAIGVALRFVKDYNIMTDLSPARLDMIFGFKTVRPEMACRICA